MKRDNVKPGEVEIKFILVIRLCICKSLHVTMCVRGSNFTALMGIEVRGVNPVVV